MASTFLSTWQLGDGKESISKPDSDSRPGGDEGPSEIVEPPVIDLFGNFGLIYCDGWMAEWTTRGNRWKIEDLSGTFSPTVGRGNKSYAQCSNKQVPEGS